MCARMMIYYLFLSLTNSVQHHKVRQRRFHNLEHYIYSMNKIQRKNHSVLCVSLVRFIYTCANIWSDDFHLPTAVIPQGFILLFIINSSIFCIFTGVQYQQLQYLQNTCARVKFIFFKLPCKNGIVS